MREVLIYGEINRWGWESSAAGISRVLQEIGPNAPITLRVHSPGGSPFEASAMRARLEQHAGPVSIVVDGLAASAAAQLLATAGADVALADGAFVMIHNTSALADGDHKDLAAALSMLRTVDQQTAELLAKRTGKSAEAIAEMMDATTWMSAHEAVKQGFADRVIAASRSDLQQRFDLSGYSNVPRQLVEKWTVTQSTCNGDRMDPKVIRQRLGLPETATDEEVFKALDTARTPQAAPAAAAPAVQSAPDQAVIDAAVQRALEARAPLPGVAEAHQTACTAAVERFIAARKIRPADRQKAIKACGDTAQSLSAVVEYWEGQPELLPAAQQLDGAPAQQIALSPLAERMCRETGVKPETIRQIMAEENAR